MSNIEEDSYSRLEPQHMNEGATARFLLNSKLEKYYKGEIYKRYGFVTPNVVFSTLPKMVATMVRGFRDFYSYKFQSNINSTPRTFCVTFREKFFKGLRIFSKTKTRDIDKYHIRLSLTEYDTDRSVRWRKPQVKCRRDKESLLLDSEGNLIDSNDNRTEVPVFSSITTGSDFETNNSSEIRDMEELETSMVPEYISITTENIVQNIGRLGKLLVNHCDQYAHTSPPAPPPPAAAPTSPLAPPTFPPSLEQKETSKRVTFPNDDKYTGTFLKGKKHGKGLYEWVNGDKYDGEWDDGKRHGKGVMALATGDTYDGDWSNDMFTGDGVYKSTNGNTYNGKWLNNKKDGKGVFTWANHATYDGFWSNDKRQGEGVFMNFKGEKYDGEWFDDKRQGKGVLTFANNDTYDGEWFDGKKNGKGVYTDASNGNKTTQNWNNGKMVEEGVATGGATRRHTRLTRRRKSVFKRKGKKSYRKKKYGKTKKSRRFRRSVRSRR